jgi:hypothetical protein
MLPNTASSELDPLDDPDTAGAMRLLHLSRKSIYRLGKAGEIDGYLLCNRRRWRREIGKGPQFDQAPGKRRVGRPPKPRSGQGPSAPSAGE